MSYIYSNRGFLMIKPVYFSNLHYAIHINGVTAQLLTITYAKIMDKYNPIVVDVDNICHTQLSLFIPLSIPSNYRY